MIYLGNCQISIKFSKKDNNAVYYLGQGITCKIEFLGIKKNPQHQCTTYLKKKGSPKKTVQNMIPSSVSPECQGLMQWEEILIAGAFPMMQVYIKP